MIVAYMKKKNNNQKFYEWELQIKDYFKKEKN